MLEKKGTFPFFCCASVPPHMCPRYQLTKPPKVMLFSHQYVKISISTVVQLCIWHRQLFIHDAHFKSFLFFEVGRTGYHGSTTSGPNVLLNSNFHPRLFYTSNFWGEFFFMFFCIVFYLFFPSLFWPPFLSIYPSLTFIWKNIPDALLSFSETWCLFSVP